MTSDQTPKFVEKVVKASIRGAEQMRSVKHNWRGGGEEELEEVERMVFVKWQSIGAHVTAGGLG